MGVDIKGLLIVGCRAVNCVQDGTGRTLQELWEERNREQGEKSFDLSGLLEIEKLGEMNRKPEFIAGLDAYAEDFDMDEEEMEDYDEETRTYMKAQRGEPEPLFIGFELRSCSNDIGFTFDSLLLEDIHRAAAGLEESLGKLGFGGVLEIALIQGVT